MKKHYFLLLVGFMVLSIVGIISVQVFWMRSAWETKEEEFALAVEQSLEAVASEIQEREISDYIFLLQQMVDSVGKPQRANFTDIFLFLDEDKSSNLSTFYSYGILEQDYNISINPPSEEPDLAAYDSTQFKDFKQVKTTTVINKIDADNFNRENIRSSSLQKIRQVDRIKDWDWMLYRDAFRAYANTLPIHKRVSTQEIRQLLERELHKKDIMIPYVFGIYSGPLTTKVRSAQYSEQPMGPMYKVPIFVDEQGKSPYQLQIAFPDKARYVMSSLFGVAGISIFLTLFIIIVSSSALYQIIRQKNISEMKTDFINNMSHEFKTPIATINLALDAISNTKARKDETRVEKYLSLIREENSRMLGQVETVLQISQLDRSANPIQKERVDFHEVVEEAIHHISLLVKNRQGTIDLKLQDSDIWIFGNKNHLINVVVNILDNAIKYSEGAPQIKVQTQTQNDRVLLRIEDRGMGMDAATQKLIFERFYREQSGNIHNIKGHGLGLSYVKKIADLHQAKIDLESKKGKGTTFTLSFPLTTPKTI